LYVVNLGSCVCAVRASDLTHIPITLQHQRSDYAPLPGATSLAHC